MKFDNLIGCIQTLLLHYLIMLDQENSVETVLETESLGNRLKHRIESLLANLYRVFYFLHQSQNRDHRLERQTTKYYVHYFFMLVYTLQLLSLTLPAYQIQDGHDFENFFYGISVFRFDFSAILCEVGDAFYYFTIIFISIPALSLLHLYITFLRLKSPNQRNYKYLVIFPIKILKNYGFIPCLSILLLVYKYTSTSE